MPRSNSTERPGSGSKPTWASGKTKVIRVPELLADQLLEIARILDKGGSVSVVPLLDDKSSKEKVIDLSGISIQQSKGAIAIHLEDLVRAGFEIRPLGLAKIVQARIDRITRG